MVIQWKRKQLRVELPDHPDPSQVKEVTNWEVNNAGITNPQVIRLAHPASAVPNTRAHPGSPEEVWTPLDQRAEAHRRHRQRRRGYR